MTVIDANGLILGRLASVVAKQLLSGDENIFIVNAEKAVISGSRAATLKEYRETRVRGATEFGPYFPKRPERILKRTVRGMLPYKRARGKDAMSRLKVYVGIPAELKGADMITLDDADMRHLSSNRYVELGEVSQKLGSKF
ncbi:50S ribosomal protein L13 [Methanosarcina sp. KYL-1]|uniref:50S ribosomal protein L13 n=1 Tax=Methanosarcina sp. KYL-1 TaxID=2602068 RepID=UPI0021018440|nr:50S ribosomal protein L13 [Methanosarcina sp. KYL-1]MCQ1534578.1 50S ribosomal protein L13 [Methanosarcina sp. KYL-1]